MKRGWVWDECDEWIQLSAINDYLSPWHTAPVEMARKGTAGCMGALWQNSGPAQTRSALVAAERISPAGQGNLQITPESLGYFPADDADRADRTEGAIHLNAEGTEDAERNSGVLSAFFAHSAFIPLQSDPDSSVPSVV